uniref:Helicase ATP-binding domain-containing protein n=1 Tax=Globodera rostochiensis TaxID=31243 RepID=A0A914GVH9_GLORO
MIGFRFSMFDAGTAPDWLKAHKLKMEAEVELEQVEELTEQRRKVEQKLEMVRQRQKMISQRQKQDGWPAGKRKHFESVPLGQETGQQQQSRQDGAEHEDGDQDLIPSGSDEEDQSGANVCSKSETNEQSKEEEEEQPPLLCRKIIYASRTHSQLEQFAQELTKTDFRPRVLTLGSRQMLCVNDAVRSLGVTGLINDRCNELLSGVAVDGGEKRTRRGEDGQMTAKVGKKGCGCEFARAEAIEDLCGAALVANTQPPSAGGDMRELGRRRRACPYFATRAALGLCQLVLVPYNILLHKATRDAWRLDLRDNVLIVDEAHNLLQTLSSIHAVELSMAQLSVCSSLLHDYAERFRTRLSPRNLRHIRQLRSLAVALHNLANSFAPPAAANDCAADETVLTLTQFMAKLGSAADIDLFRLLAYLEQSKLCRKLRDFRLRHAHVQPQPLLVSKENGAGGLKSLIDRAKMGEDISPSNDSNTPPAATTTASSSTPLYQLREFIEAIITSRTEDARIVISRRRPLSDSAHKIVDVRLRFLLLNPAARLGELVTQARTLILLGGTMRPTDQLIDALRRVCAVPDQRIVQFTCGHVIDDKQLIALQIGNGPDGSAQPLNLHFAARCSPPALTAVAQCLLALLRLHLRTSGHWEQLQRVKRVHVEAKAETNDGPQPQQQIWPAFCESARSCQGAVLFAVVGGKLSEGINFSDELGRCVLMVGLPYPNRNSAELKERIRYLDKHSGPGAGTRFYEQLCLQAINQAIGRAIRHRADYAAIVLLDERYARETIAGGLPGWIRQRLTRAVALPEALQRLERFFRTQSDGKAGEIASNRSQKCHQNMWWLRNMRPSLFASANFYFFFFFFLFIWHFDDTLAKDFEPVADDKATDYLLNFGYVEPGKLQEAGGTEDKEDILQKAIKTFQSFAHLPETGKLDIKTKKKMAQPRCGMQDAQMILGSGGGPKWNKNLVTFKVHNFSPQLPQSRIRDAIKRAYDTWAQVIPVSFQETQGQADINVQFAARSHGDPWPFDGRSGVLAHATMPTDGKLHFDEDERWALGPEDARKIANGYTDLFPVAVHEIGHTLGLEHSKVENAIMAPFYQESVDESGNYIPQTLKPDDIKRIQAIYGSGRGGGGGRTPTPSAAGGGRKPSASGGGRTGGSSGGRAGSSRGTGSAFGDDDWGSSAGGFGGSGGRGGSTFGSGSGGSRSRLGNSGGDDWGGLFGSSGSSRTKSWQSPDGRTRSRVTVSGTDWPSSSSSRGHKSGGGRGLDLDSLFSKWMGRRR